MEKKQRIYPPKMHAVIVKYKELHVIMHSTLWNTTKRMECKPEYSDSTQQAIDYMESRGFHVIGAAELPKGGAILLTECFDKF